jgi:hypothetical protein
MQNEIKGRDVYQAQFSAIAVAADRAKIIGRFSAICRDKDGKILWSEDFDNLLTQVGKALLLDFGLNASSYTAAEWMGLISSVSYSAVSGGDTMSTHPGWLEAGTANAPTYSGARIPCTWNASTLSGASAYSATKTLAAGLTFTFTGAGTVQGGFLIGGSGASNSIGATTGILFSAGTFSTPQPVVSTNTLTISYSTTLT